MGVQPMNRRSAHRCLALLLTPLIAFTMFALASPVVGQEGNGSASAQQSANPATQGVYKVGGDVSAPVLIHSVEPQYSDKDGEANVTGTVQLMIWVDINGTPTHIHVTRGLGMKLDEKALMAVHQYRYKPAMKDGKPVMVELNVEVKFQKSAN
jgi:protein TonB